MLVLIAIIGRFTQRVGHVEIGEVSLSGTGAYEHAKAIFRAAERDAPQQFDADGFALQTEVELRAAVMPRRQRIPAGMTTCPLSETVTMGIEIPRCLIKVRSIMGTRCQVAKSMGSPFSTGHHSGMERGVHCEFRRKGRSNQQTTHRP
jgi:hypothetical protein